MAEAPLFAHRPEGGLSVLADGPELFVHAEPGDAPKWRTVLDDDIVRVGATSDVVYAVGSSGRLYGFGARDGAPAPVPSGAFGGLSVSDTGRIALFASMEVLFCEGTRVFDRISLPGAIAVAFAPDGRRAGVGTADGTFLVRAFGQPGDARDRLQLGAPILAVCWLDGDWVVAAGPAIYRVTWPDRPGAIPVARPLFNARATVLGLAVTPDQALIACQVEGQKVGLLASDGAGLGEIRFRRPLSGVAFGNANSLVVGLDFAELCRFDLSSGSSTRSPPFRNRDPQALGFDVLIDPGRVRNARLRAAAGGEEIAVWLKGSGESASGGWGCSIAFGCMTLLGICAGCGGLFSYGRQVGWW